MIPKIIHYVWLGGKKPQDVLDCIKSWRDKCPDYEIREWNETNSDLNCCDFIREAYAHRKMAFVSDVIRLRVLSEYGGIYLDTDVRLLKSFDDFLGGVKSFVGREVPFQVSTAVIGCEPHVQWIEEFLRVTYLTKGKHFVLRSGVLDVVPNTQKLSSFLNNTWHRHSQEIAIYPEDYFCCKSFFTGEISTTENSVAIHDFACTWKVEQKLTVFGRMKNLAIRAKLFLKKIGISKSMSR